MREIKKQEKCRICKSTKLYEFLNLGKMPIPNGFLKKENLRKTEKKYPLVCMFCENCGLVQLSHVVNPRIMFSDYVYIPSGAKIMMNNFSNLAYQACKKLKLNEKDLVIDIGSNDGSLLTFFKSYGVKVLGIDPAKNLAKVAELNGIPTEILLFGSKSAMNLSKKYGKAKVITATNVIAHVDGLHEVLEGVDGLLAKNGLFITEFPYLVDLIDKNQFDTIYHEHLSYFSLKPWKKLIEEFGFEIVGAQRLLIHGGSIRLTHKKIQKGKNTENRVVDYLVSLEEKAGLYETKTYDLFAQRIEKMKDDLLKTLNELKKNRNKIVGYGAPAKGNVLTNYFDIGTDILDYIVDSTPYKQGLYTPGKHIPIYPESKLMQDIPDYSLIFAWNFANEIISKQRNFKKGGGKFIIPIPRVKII